MSEQTLAFGNAARSRSTEARILHRFYPRKNILARRIAQFSVYKSSEGIVIQDVRGVDRGAPLGYRRRLRGQQGRRRLLLTEVPGMCCSITLYIKYQIMKRLDVD